MDERTIVFAGDPFNFRSFARPLEQRGFKAEILQTAEAVLGYAQTHTCCAIVTDQCLPHGSVFKESETQGYTRTGEALARELRTFLPTTPIIIIAHEPVTLEGIANLFVYKIGSSTTETISQFVLKKLS